MSDPLTHEKSKLGAIRKFWFGRVPIVDNRPVGRGIYLVRLHAPEVARQILPGQFVMLRLPETVDPLLGRAFALFDTEDDAAGKPNFLLIVYEVVGKMTRRLAQLAPGNQLEMWGPLGNGFSGLSARRLILVAGGIGITPFMAYCRWVLGLRSYGQPAHDTRLSQLAARPEVILCYGARSAEELVFVDDFRALGIRVLTSTDDGSAGKRGQVTDLLGQVLEETLTAGAKADGGPPERLERASQQGDDLQVVACGPEAMMAAAACICQRFGVLCWVSLETPMACGMGICFGCAVPVYTEGSNWDYKRACTDGPVFPAEKIAWDVLLSHGSAAASQSLPIR